MDLFTLVLLGLFAVLVFFMFRSSSKRKREMQELSTKIVVGAEVMTNFGLFGTIISLDDEENQAVVETTPGTRLRIHRQTITRLITPQEEESPASDDSHDDEGEPEFGERIEATESTDSDPKKGTTNKRKLSS